MDIITHCTDTLTLITELQELAPELINIEENGEVSFLVSKTPIVRNGNETLSLVRDSDGKLQTIATQLSTLDVLGTYDEVFNDPAKLEIYNRVYNQTPTVVVDEGGIEHVQTVPQKFGVFISDPVVNTSDPIIYPNYTPGQDTI